MQLLMICVVFLTASSAVMSLSADLWKNKLVNADAPVADQLDQVRELVDKVYGLSEKPVSRDLVGIIRCVAATNLTLVVRDLGICLNAIVTVNVPAVLSCLGQLLTDLTAAVVNDVNCIAGEINVAGILNQLLGLNLPVGKEVSEWRSETRQLSLAVVLNALVAVVSTLLILVLGVVVPALLAAVLALVPIVLTLTVGVQGVALGLLAIIG